MVWRQQLGGACIPEVGPERVEVRIERHAVYAGEFVEIRGDLAGARQVDRLQQQRGGPTLGGRCA